jgi:hypothetical protein
MSFQETNNTKLWVEISREVFKRMVSFFFRIFFFLKSNHANRVLIHVCSSPYFNASFIFIVFFDDFHSVFYCSFLENSSVFFILKENKTTFGK